MTSVLVVSSLTHWRSRGHNCEDITQPREYVRRRGAEVRSAAPAPHIRKQLTRFSPHRLLCGEEPLTCAMKGSGLLVAAVLLILSGRGAECSDPRIITSSPDGPGGEMLMCNLTDLSFQISGHQWLKGHKVMHEDKDGSQITTYNISEVNVESSGQYTCKFLTVPDLIGVINVTVPPHVMAYKKTEHGNEGDTGVLTCKSNSYPLVEQWMWYRSSEDGSVEPIVNGTDERYVIKSTGNKTELRINQLDIEKDQGDYICNGSNVLGNTGATIALRVRSRLAALWPFLGIVAEVLILVTIIFIYEKRRKPDEAPEDEDGGSAPLKSNAGANHETVRQRNSS